MKKPHDKLRHNHAPAMRREAKTDRAGFDNVGTLLLALTLAAYALAVGVGTFRRTSRTRELAPQAEL